MHYKEEEDKVSLLWVNDCFKNESNAVFGVFLQRLIILPIECFKRGLDLLTNSIGNFR